MIKSFGEKKTRRFVEEGVAEGFLKTIIKPAGRKITMLQMAASLSDLAAFPGNRLEKLKGKRNGQYSVRINDQFRICFRFENGDAFDVEITDYH
ncbi:MAG: type II toxin-antitoxin system RelE/ParE family toxin [Nitrospinae bacterium]|nr:type II toxin-antitoxin system RelE/ParE family toxin [Nitrospinota bacterium]